MQRCSLFTMAYVFREKRKKNVKLVLSSIYRLLVHRVLLLNHRVTEGVSTIHNVAVQQYFVT
jgi:hypothetical protein